MYARARRTCELPRATERWSSKCVGGFFTLRRYTTDCCTCVSASAAAAVLLCSCAATIVFAVAAGLSFDLSCSGYHSRIPGNQVQLVCAYGTYEWPTLYSHIPIRTYSSPMFCILLYVQQPAGFNTTHARGTQSEADVYRGLHPSVPCNNRPPFRYSVTPSTSALCQIRNRKKTVAIST